MGSLVIDVTQLAEWQGKLTGIPRVMNELSLRFGTTSDCRLVVWDKVAHDFRDITLQQLAAERVTSVPEAAPQPSHMRVKRVVRAVETRLPGAERARRRLQSMVVQRRTARREVASGPAGAAIAPDDVLFILWGAWDDGVYINTVLSLADRGTRLVQVAYDMLPLVTPQFSGHATDALNNYVTQIYPKCSLLLSISEHTKRDLISWLTAHDLHVPPIRVFRLGDDFAMSKPSRPTDAVFKKSGCKGDDYILVVGTIEARKNHTLLYYTYKLAQQRGVALPKLVIVGRRGWLTDNIFTLMTTDPETAPNFVFLQNTTDEELAWLYEHCLFTVYPSFYEGWGLPIAESIAHGVPCIASNTSSMPEVAGDLISYFSPVSTEECLEAVSVMLQPKQLKAAKEKVKRYQPTSWDTTFETVKLHIEKEVRS